MSLDRFSLQHDLAGHVAVRIDVVLPLDEEVGTNRRNAVDGIRRLGNRDPIDVFQRGEHLGAQGLVEHGSTRSFVDESVGRQRDDKHVTQPTRRLEVTDMAQMDQIEGTVGLHDSLPMIAAALGNRRDFLDRLDFIARGPGKLRRQTT